MKILIKESQMNLAIEQLIKRSVNNVVSVNFKEKQAMAYDKEKTTYTKTVIQVIADPGNVLEGNTYNFKRGDYKHKEMRYELTETLKRYMDIELYEFKSPYDLELFIVSTTEV